MLGVFSNLAPCSLSLFSLFYYKQPMMNNARSQIGVEFEKDRKRMIPRGLDLNFDPILRLHHDIFCYFLEIFFLFFPPSGQVNLRLLLVLVLTGEGGFARTFSQMGSKEQVQEGEREKCKMYKATKRQVWFGDLQHSFLVENVLSGSRSRAPQWSHHIKERKEKKRKERRGQEKRRTRS